MPWLVRNAGHGFAAARIALNKAVPRRKAAERPAYAVRGEVRADKVNVFGRASKIDGQAGLVLAAPGQGDVLPGEGFAAFGHRAVPNPLLLGLAAPAGYGHNLPRAAAGGNAFPQQARRVPREQDIRVPLVGRTQRRRFLFPQRIAAVYQDDGAAMHVRSAVKHGFHACPSSPSAIIRSSRAGKSSPISCIMRG